MKNPKVPFLTGWLLLGLVLAGAGIWVHPADGAFIEKKFTVCKDRGSDILCDPYVVRPNDWVTKLFRQRGEISQKDYPEFLEIFKRINPDLPDVNTIYPGQRILIPLKILEPDSLEGQASGSVTIPVITITSIPVKLIENSMIHVVQEGESVSTLLNRDFGPVNSRKYRQALQIFKYINPDLKNLNMIRVGQELKLPKPGIQEQEWYAGLFDASGELMVKAEKEAPPPRAEKPKTQTPPAPIPAPVSEIAEIAPIETQSELLLEELQPIAPTALSDPLEELKPSLPFAYKKAASLLGATLLNKGEYFFPRIGREDLKLDLASNPVMEFPDGLKLLFVQEDLAETDRDVIRSFWKKTRVVTAGEDPSVRDLLDSICPAIHEDGCENKFTITDQSVIIDVRGEYIYDTPGQSGKTVLTLIENPKEAMPEIIRDYLKQHQVTINEWVSRKSVLLPVSTDSTRGAVYAPPAVVLDAADPPDFVRNLLSLLGVSYQEGIEVSFPYAGFQVSAQSNLLSLGTRGEYLIDFGNFQGDAVRAIESTGFKVIQITAKNDPDAIFAALLDILPVDRTETPVFFAAHRPRIYNTSISIPGQLITRADAGENGLLVTSAALQPDILAFLNQSGIRVVRIRPDR